MFAKPQLIEVFKEIGLSVVNSERKGFEWLPTLSENEKCGKRPDLILCNPCFYEAKAQPEVKDGVLSVKTKLLGDGKLLYGIKAGRPERFLDDIFILEGKFEKLSDTDWGQVKTYAGLQARRCNNPAFHRLALFDREKFILFLSKGGDFYSATECGWDAPGSMKLMQNFFDDPSPLVKALKASCVETSVTPCTPQVNSPCILGAGGSGVVFRVTPTDADADLAGRLGSTRSETVALQNKALKVVVGEAVDLLSREWEATKKAKTHCGRVVTVDDIFIGKGFGAYVMNEVGTAVDTSTIEQKKALFTALHDLHIHGVVHGDARVQNAITLPDGFIMWIDFARSFISSKLSPPVADDFSLLFTTVFGQTPSAAQVETYEQCVETKQINDEAWISMGLS
jgi:hypothetical protein